MRACVQEAKSHEQLSLVATLLSGVWQDGAALPPPVQLSTRPAHSSKATPTPPTPPPAAVETPAAPADSAQDDGAEAAEAAGEGAGEGWDMDESLLAAVGSGAAGGVGGGEQEEEEGGAPPPSAKEQEEQEEEEDEGACPLHQSWAEVLWVAAQRQHYTLVISALLGSGLAQGDGGAGRGRLLSARDVQQLVARLLSASSSSSSGSSAALAALVSVWWSSGGEQQHATARRLFAERGEALLLAEGVDGRVALALGRACLERRLLLQLPADDAARVEAALAALALRHSQQQQPQGAAAAAAPTLRWLLVGAVAQLCEAKRLAAAAALASRACGWSVALGALGGSLHFLEHFLVSVMQWGKVRQGVRRTHVATDCFSPCSRAQVTLSGSAALDPGSSSGGEHRQQRLGAGDLVTGPPVAVVAQWVARGLQAVKEELRA